MQVVLVADSFIDGISNRPFEARLLTSSVNVFLFGAFLTRNKKVHLQKKTAWYLRQVVEEMSTSYK